MSSNAIKARGTFNLKVYKGGQLVEDYTDNNLVVTLGRRNVARLLGGTGFKVSKIAAGTNGTAPALTDAGITGMFAKAIEGTSFPETNSVLFTWTLGNADANGMTIQEFGLLDDDNNLFARKTRTPIDKTSDMVLVGTWKIVVN